MGVSLGNISLKHDSAEEVIEYLSSGSDEGEVVQAFISEPLNGHVCIFPENENFKFLSDLSQKLSEKFNTLSCCGQVYDSEDVIVDFYHKGELKYRYYFGSTEKPMEEPEIKGSYEDLFEVAEVESEINVKEKLEKFQERFLYAEDRYIELITPLGFPYYLRTAGYRYIKNEIDRFEDGLEVFNESPENPTLFSVEIRNTF